MIFKHPVRTVTGIIAAAWLFAGAAWAGWETVPLAPAPTPNSQTIPAGSELTLNQALRIALEFHPLRQQAQAATGAASERIGEAQAELLPQLYGTSQYLRSTHNGIGNTEYYSEEGLLPRLTGSNHDQSANDLSQNADSGNNYLFGLTASQYLLDFGRAHGFVTQRRYEAAAVKEQERVVDLDLIFEVSRSYFSLLAAQQMVRVYDKAVEQRRYHLHEAEVKVKVALRPQLDTFVMQAELARSQLHLVQAHNAVADAKVALDNAMGLSDQAPEYRPADVLAYSPIADNLSELVRSAHDQRPDLLALEDQVRAMGAQIQEYRSDYFPQAGAIAGYNALGTGLPAVNNFNVGLVIYWPLFNGFLTTHEMQEARLRQEALQRAMEALRQQVTLQVQTAFIDWQSSFEQINRAQQALAASQVQLTLAEKRYQAGLTSIVELEDAQRHYTFDDAEYANALYGFSLAKVTVDRATGRALAQLP